MWAAIFVLVFAAFVLVMATLGAVLVTRFVLGTQASARRVLAAALGGPLSLILPGMMAVLFDTGGVDTSALIGFGVLGVFAFGAIGWPVAHFATRRLDRLTAFDPQVFE
jgi:uncharacterized protein YggT (Ycf19 family)